MRDKLSSYVRCGPPVVPPKDIIGVIRYGLLIYGVVDAAERGSDLSVAKLAALGRAFFEQLLEILQEGDFGLTEEERGVLGAISRKCRKQSAVPS